MNALRSLLFVLLAAATASADFSIEQVMSAPFPTDLVAAPTGNRVAWVSNSRGRRNIWVADGPEFRPRQLTSYTDDDGQDIGQLRFSPDGHTVVYVRGGPKNQAGDIPNPTSDPGGAEQAVWAVDVSAGASAPRKLGAGSAPLFAPSGDRVVFLRDGQVWTAEGQLFKARGTIGSLEWSPDGSRLAFVSTRATHSFVGVYDTRANSVRFIAPSVDRDIEPRWSPDGKRIAFIRMATAGAAPGSFEVDRDTRWSIQVADVTTGQVRTVWQAPAREGGSFWNVTGDAVLQWAAAARGGSEEARLTFTAELDGWNRIYSVAAAGGEPVALTASACEVEEATLTRDRRTIVFTSNCGDINRRHLARVAVLEGPPSPISTGSGIEYSPRLLGDGRTIAYLAADARRPASPHIITLNGSPKPRPIAAQSLLADFPVRQLVEPQAVMFKAADGVEVHGQLFVSASPSRRAPAVIFVHGGPQRQMLLAWHYRPYYHNAYALNQYMASRGYVVLSVNYRAGIGYGRAFRLAKNRGSRGAAEYQDVVAGAQYLHSRNDVDPARIGIWGGSYGGYLTAMALARNSDLFAAGVDIHGVHDWSAFRSRSSLPRDADATKLARESSPMASVKNWRSPVLLIHGDDDRNVQFAQTVELVARLREQGVTFEQIVFPDEVHDFLRHERWLETYRVTAAFFDKHLKGTLAQ